MTIDELQQVICHLLEGKDAAGKRQSIIDRLRTVEGSI
jgi:hypothetical protein